MRARIIFCWILLAGSCNACAFKHATLFPPPPGPKKPITDVYTILLLLDGARPQDLDALAASGRLPNFQQLFYERGARFQNAVAVVPTASTPSHQSFISGLFPGHHGIPNLDWFSRPMIKHIDYLRPTEFALTNTYMFNFKQALNDRILTDRPQLIYHDLEGYPSLAVFETAASGATRFLPQQPPLITAYHGKVEGFYEQFDLEAMRLTLEHLQGTPLEEFPRFTYISCYGMDLVTHFDGILGDRTRDLYLLYDRFLGELEQTLRDRGIWEKTTLVVLSDHGQHALNRVTDLPALLRRAGLKYREQVRYGDHGLSFTNLYLKSGPDWKTRPTFHDLKNFPLEGGRNVDLLASFQAEPDVEFVVTAEGPWKVHLYRRGQHALILRRIEDGVSLYAYLPDPGQDPLEYLGNAKIAAWVGEKKFADPETWLTATRNLEFPDAVVQLSQLFADYRVGDILLFTAKDTQFKEKRLAGHGSFYAEDLQILIMFHGANIRPGVYPQARSVDLYPTLLALFGLSPSGPVDGVLRAEIFQNLPESARASAATRAEGNFLPVSSFQENLKRKLQTDSLTSEEREKAKQVLYSLEQFEADQRHYAMPGKEGDETGVARQH